ncbi:MAG TPA: cell division protein FtsL [Geobacteraceae bacterium]|nr:cell division protein FtsL [Geobacteraceae bacterium]
MAHIKTMSNKVAAPPQFDAVEVHARRWDLFSHLMVVMVLLTLVSIFHVWSRVKVIDLNLRMADVNSHVKEVQQEQNRLKLEVASLKTPARIEALAKGDLGMALPTDQQVVIVK